jgi:hypothetical protein
VVIVASFVIDAVMSCLRRYDVVVAVAGELVGYIDVVSIELAVVAVVGVDGLNLRMWCESVPVVVRSMDCVVVC